MSRRDPNELTPKQALFVREYLCDMNATRAYRRAGYKASTDEIAAVEGYKLLNKPNVKRELARLMREREVKTGITARRVLEELACIALADPGEVLDFSGGSIKIRPPCEIPEHARRTIASFEERPTRYGTVQKVTFWSKTSGIKDAMAHLGLFEKDNEQKNPAPVPGALPLDKMELSVECRRELLAAVRKLREQQSANGTLQPPTPTPR